MIRFNYTHDLKHIFPQLQSGNSDSFKFFCFLSENFFIFNKKAGSAFSPGLFTVNEQFKM